MKANARLRRWHRRLPGSPRRQCHGFRNFWIALPIEQEEAERRCSDWPNGKRWRQLRELLAARDDASATN